MAINKKQAFAEQYFKPIEIASLAKHGFTLRGINGHEREERAKRVDDVGKLHEVFKSNKTPESERAFVAASRACESYFIALFLGDEFGNRAVNDDELSELDAMALPVRNAIMEAGNLFNGFSNPDDAKKN